MSPSTWREARQALLGEETFELQRPLSLLHLRSACFVCVNLPSVSMAFFLEPWNPVDPDLFRKSSLEYFPDRSPLARGDHGTTPRPISFAMGISSRSVVRSMRLYSICSATSGDHPRRSAMACILEICHAGVSEIPA